MNRFSFKKIKKRENDYSNLLNLDENLNNLYFNFLLDELPRSKFIEKLVKIFSKHIIISNKIKTFTV